MNRFAPVTVWLLTSAFLLFAGCAQKPVRTPAEAPAKPVPAVKAPEPPPPLLPNQELTRDTLYRFLLGEVAGQRGRLDVASQAYIEMAKSTRDPRIAQRATEIALFARNQEQALEASKIWLEADPNAVRARQAVAALLVSANRLDEAKPHLEKLLADEKENVGPGFLQLNNLLARANDKQAALVLVQDLAKPYPGIAEAHFAVAQAALNANQTAIAVAESERAMELRPDWEIGALMHGQALQRRTNADALAYWADYLERYPKAKDVRLNYARLLVVERDYPKAKAEFEKLEADYPQNAEVALAIGLLATQVKDYDAAEQQFKRVLALDYKDADSVRMYLGQVNEDRKRFDEAKRWYKEVSRGDQYVGAQARYAGIIAKEGDTAGARRYLQEVPVANNQQRVQLIQAEAQLLRDQGQYQESFDLLGQSLEKLPNYPDLLYDYAMAAEKVNRIDVLEVNLRKLIALKPDHAHAYNALGYTLADRTDRLKEAEEFIDQALKLSPDDPFILDSKGWVLYRRGNAKEALEYLRRAFAERPDPEIAAHLGEVLWASGSKSEAEKVVRQALQDHPENEALQTTMKRFAP